MRRIHRMPQWLQIYLAFTLAGGMVTYFTVIRQVVNNLNDIDEVINLYTEYPIFGFITWSLSSVITGPFLFIIIVTGRLEEFKQKLTERWLDNAGFDD